MLPVEVYLDSIFPVSARLPAFVVYHLVFLSYVLFRLLFSSSPFLNFTGPQNIRDSTTAQGLRGTGAAGAATGGDCISYKTDVVDVLIHRRDVDVLQADLLDPKEKKGRGPDTGPPA